MHLFERSKALCIRKRTRSDAHSTEVLSMEGDGSHRKQVWRVLRVCAPCPWLCSLLAEPGRHLGWAKEEQPSAVAPLVPTALRLVESETGSPRLCIHQTGDFPTSPLQHPPSPTRDSVWEWEEWQEGEPRAEGLIQACNPNSKETKAGRLSWVFGKPGLNSEFKGSQGSIVRLSQEDRRQTAVEGLGS